MPRNEILTSLGVSSDCNAAGLVRDLLAEKGIKTHFYEPAPSAESESSDQQASTVTQLLVRAKDLASARQQLEQTRQSDMVAQEELPAIDGSNRPVMLRRYRDMPPAIVEKCVLDNAGIECFLQDDNVVRMDWLWSNAMGGIKLVVREKDAEEANTILSLLPAEDAENAGSDAP